MAKSKKTSSAPGFLKIAGELRNQIYDYFFNDIDSISMTDAVPGLVQTCRLLREETLLIWHGKHQHVKATIKHDGAHADTEPLVDYLTNTPVALTAAIQTFEITWIMSREDERCMYGRGAMWRPVRAALKHAGVSSKQIVWRFQGGRYLEEGDGFKWVQRGQAMRETLLEKRMEEFLDGDGEMDCPLWDVGIVPRHWDDWSEVMEITYD